jgi:Flp pilus assembly protein TadG
MRTKMMSFLRKAFADQGGQSMVILVGAVLSLCAMAGLTLDVGHAYSVRTQLQNSVNAAGLAAAGFIYNKQTADTDSAVTIALDFAKQNPVPGLTPTTTATLVCREALQAKPWTCVTNPVKNAIVVSEQVDTPTTFMRIFGYTKMSVSATATASMQSSGLWNIAVIEDLTGSMNNTDTNCSSMSEFSCTLNALQGWLATTNPCPGTGTTGSACKPDDANLRIAIFGFPNMLTTALPAVTTCSAAPSTPFTVDTLPLEDATSYAPMTYHYTYNGAPHDLGASYELTYGASGADANGFLSDYYDPTNKSTGGLNPTSALVQAIGYTGTSSKTGCLKLVPNETATNGAISPTAAGTVASNGDWSGSSGKDKNGKYPIVNTVKVGEGLTYIASAIYAAQAALIAEQARMNALGKVTQNAMIIQSDGTMNMQWIYFPLGLVTQKPPSNTEPNSGKWASPYNGYNLRTPATIDATLGYSNTTSTPNENAVIAKYITGGPGAEAVSGTISGLYPDFIDECQQTIIAAQKATVKGIEVFSIAYGASTTTDCGLGNTNGHNDVTLLPTSAFPLPLNVPFTLSTLTGCVEMKNAATDVDHFYSYSPSGTSNGCADSVHTSTTLASILKSIGSHFGKPKLIPNNAT